MLALAGVVLIFDRSLSGAPAPRPLAAARERPVALAGPIAPLSGGGKLGVAGVAPSACLSFAPTSSDSGRTVFLDPGHGGPDPGAVGVAAGRQVQEKDATLAVGLQLAALLRGDGYRVVLSRTADTLVTQTGDADFDQGALRPSAERRDLLARVACANASHAAALLSIHFNGFDDPGVGGTEVFYDADRPFSDQNQQLATLLQAALVKALGSDDRGILTDDQLDAPTLTTQGGAYGHFLELGPAQAGWIDQPTQMPGALAEPLFVTDPQDAQVLSSAAGQRLVAGGLAAGLESFLQKTG